MPYLLMIGYILVVAHLSKKARSKTMRVFLCSVGGTIPLSFAVMEIIPKTYLSLTIAIVAMFYFPIWAHNSPIQRANDCDSKH